jgi:endonuclease/exonuclease/phosphatase family metal-dependent hydrolase
VAAEAFGEVVSSVRRSAPFVRLRLPLPVTLASVHLDAFDASARRAQLEELLDYAARERAAGAAVLLAGDFNFDSDFVTGEPVEELAPPDLALYRMLGHGFVDAGRSAGPTTVAERRLDYVFASAPLRSSGARVLGGSRINLMDHEPLLSQLRFP